jgi:hypothetical protein
VSVRAIFKSRRTWPVRCSRAEKGWADSKLRNLQVCAGQFGGYGLYRLRKKSLISSTGVWFKTRPWAETSNSRRHLRMAR